MTLTGCSWPIAVDYERPQPKPVIRDGQKTADSVEKVGHGFHNRKVRV
jgi:hypothetical protein